MYDVIVVGAGSGGGPLAARLSEDSGCRVLLLEAGPDLPQEQQQPPGFVAGGAISGEHGAGSGPPVPEYDWGYRSEPLPNGRTVPLWRGKLVGGTSMINGCVAVRGRPEDYERWVAAGAAGWGWRDLQPVFETVERELHVMQYPRERWLPVQELFTQGFEELGYRYTDQLNAPDAWDGVAGPWPRSRRNEIRLGSLNTYIRQARERANFTIRGDALVDRVLFSRTRAVGVAYVDQSGEVHEVRADRIVLCGGAYGTPPILLRSGIGPSGALRALGVRPMVDLPVGQHLMEHPGLSFVLQVAPEFARMGWPSLAAVARGRGWWAIPMTYDQDQGLVGITFCLATHDGPGRGSVSLRSVRPDAHPAIDHEYRVALAEGAFDAVLDDFQAVLETQTLRGAGARDVHAGTTATERALRRLSSGTHAAGGCDIGLVVDANLQVHGVDGLYVADASVFPSHVTNNPNLTCFVVGEVLAAKLRGSA